MQTLNLLNFSLPWIEGLFWVSVCYLLCSSTNLVEYTVGYMPSDLYNLNSSYGSEEELKHCIEEMHTHDLLVCLWSSAHVIDL